MPNPQIKTITADGVTYDIVDKTSGYAPLASPALTGVPTAPTAASGTDTTQVATTAFVQDAIEGMGAGSVTSVAVSNATNGGLSVSGSPITTSGTITVGHSNVLASAQTTQAVYPITIDKNGHITAYGNAVAIPNYSAYGAIVLYGQTISLTIDDGTDMFRVTQIKPKTVDNISGVAIKYETGESTYEEIFIPDSAGFYTGMQQVLSLIPSTAANATTGISIADHSTGTITGVQSTTTSVTGVQATTTTASHVKSGGNGTAPTLGTAIEVPNVTGASNVTVPIRADSATTVPVAASSATTVPIKNATATSIPNVTAAGSGSFTQGSFSGGSFTQGTDSFTANTPTAIDTTKFNAGSYSHTGFSGGSGSFTQGSFSGGSGSFTASVTDHVLSFNHTHTAATHGADSHTHTGATYGTDNFTAPSLGTGFYTAGTAASFTQGEDEFTPATHGADSHTHTPPTLGTAISIYGVQSSTTSVTGVNGSTSVYGVKSGTNSTTTASKVTLGTAIEVPNVTSVGSASDWVFENITVPIKNASATTVPIKDASATTVVTTATHTVTDNGHTHTLE